MRDILLLAVTGSLASAALLRPVLGMVAYFAYTFAAPYAYTWGVARTFPHVQALAVCTIAGYVFQSGKSFPKQRESVLLLMLWGWFVLSTTTAFSPDDAVTQLVRMCKILLMIVLCLSLINSEERLRLLVKVVALSIGLYGLKGGVFAVLTGGGATVWGAEGTSLANSNAIGLAMAVNVPFLYYLSREESHKWLRIVMRAMLFFSYPAVICTFSRGAWLGLAAATGLIVLRRERKLSIIAAACIGLLFAGSVLTLYLPQKIADRLDALVNYEKTETAQERFWSWELCKRVGLDNPLLGAGFDFISADVYMRYMPEHLEYWSQQLNRETTREGVAWSCHNSWLTVWGEHGVVGFILLAALLGSCLITVQSMRRFGTTHKEHRWVVNYANMVEAALVAYGITGTFLDASYFDLLYFLIAVTIITKDVLQKRSRMEAPVADVVAAAPPLNPKTSLGLPA